MVWWKYKYFLFCDDKKIFINLFKKGFRNILFVYDMEDNDKMPKMPKNAEKFICELCDFECAKYSNYVKHLGTLKHENIKNGNKMVTNDNQKMPKTNEYMCKCGISYKHSSGLSRHKKKCIPDINSNTIIEPETDKNPNDKDNIIMLLIKQNDDLIKGQSNLIKEQTNLIKEQSDIKQIILELVKNGTNNAINTTNNNTINNNSHNKAFNLNFFLNETCKNAMNITEFVDSIKWELEDLMELGEIGYVASMSKIITKNLNALDETVRPIHCTDKKRETFYIKDEDKWEKEDEEMKRLRKIILRISNKSMKLLPKYREKFPDYDDAKSIRSDELCKIIIEAVTCDSAKDEKIIRNISKATMISKEASLST
jgi:hypothetical protein